MEGDKWRGGKRRKRKEKGMEGGKGEEERVPCQHFLFPLQAALAVEKTANNCSETLKYMVIIHYHGFECRFYVARNYSRCKKTFSLSSPTDNI